MCALHIRFLNSKFSLWQSTANWEFLVLFWEKRYYLALGLVPYNGPKFTRKKPLKLYLSVLQRFRVYDITGWHDLPGPGWESTDLTPDQVALGEGDGNATSGWALNLVKAVIWKIRKTRCLFVKHYAPVATKSEKSYI